MEFSDLPKPIGAFINENTDPETDKIIDGLDGRYYHYETVCSLLKKQKISLSKKEFLHHLIDVVVQEYSEDTTVPSRLWSEKMIIKATETFDENS